VGSGTQAMIALCRDANLPEPDFEQRHGFFVLTLWRDWLTDEVLTGFHLNERQLQAIAYLKSSGVITNADYQRIAGSSQRTATRDLNELVQKGLITPEGKGRGARYRLLRKRAINAPNAPS
jgi:predicted HTH transcriptional regulator